MDMRHMLEQAQNLTKALKDLDGRFKQHEVEGRAKGGLAVVRLNCDFEILGVKLAAELLAGGEPARAEQAVVEALRQALDAARKYREEQRAALAGGLKLPEL